MRVSPIRTPRPGYWLALALALAVPPSSPALAQSQGVLEEIVVTSRKREESVMEIPDAITVFSESVIETANITSIQDFAGLTPNLTIIDQLRPGTQTVTIRGMTTVQNGELPLAFVVDGVSVPSMNFINQELVDIERIEVLRGPQGTLYGRGAVGGAINIVTKQPTEEFEGIGKLTFGRGSALFAGATISGPLAPDVKFRLSASYRDEDGLIDNVGSGTEADPIEEQSIQGRLLWDATDRLSLDFRLRHLTGDAGGVYLVPVTTAQLDDFSFPVSSNLNGEDERDVTGASVKLDYDFAGGSTLTSITAYSETDQFFFGDGDFSTQTLFAQEWEIDVQAVSQELRVASDNSQRFRWLFGGFYQDREDKEFTEFGLEGPGPSVIPFEPSAGNKEIRDRTSRAIFGQVDYDITDRLELSAGLRYDEEENRTQSLHLGLVQSETFDEWQPKLSLSYDWNDHLMTFATLSRGFRPGGFSPSSGLLYENEVSDNFEIGFKSTLLDGRVRLAGSLYTIDFSDQQFFFSRATPAGVQRFIININETTNQGLEFEASARLAEGLDVTFGLGLTSTEIDDFDGTGAFVGNDTPQVNDHTANLSVQYSRPVSDRLDFTGRLDYENRGEVDWDLENLVTTPSKDYVNVYLGLENERWSAFVFGDNLLDERQPTAIGPNAFGPGLHLRTPSRPRSFGVGVRARF